MSPLTPFLAASEISNMKTGMLKVVAAQSQKPRADAEA